MKLITLVIGLFITCTLCADAKPKKNKGQANRNKSITAKVSNVVKRIEENNNSTLESGSNTRAAKAAAPDSQFRTWKTPGGIKIDPKLLNKGKKKNRKGKNRRRR